MRITSRTLAIAVSFLVTFYLYFGTQLKEYEYFHQLSSVAWKASNSSISYWIHSGTKSFLCGGPKDHNRASLHSEMQPYFNFSTSFTTNLKIIVLGDSTGNNIFDMLVNSLRLHDNNEIIPRLKLSRGGGPGSGNNVVLEIFNNNSQLGSGAIAHQRIIGMFLRKYEGWAPANWNKGWMVSDAQAFRDSVSNFTFQNKTQSQSTIKTIHLGDDKLQKQNKIIRWDESGNFDALIFKIPSPGWIPLEEVSPDTVHESIQLMHDLLGVRVVILVSLHFPNENAVRPFSRQELEEKNEMLFNFARNWTQLHGQNESGIRSVYILDSGGLNVDLTEWNAHLLGFNDVTRDRVFHFTTRKGENISKSLAHVCGKYPEDNGECVGNSITQDGMHFCIHTLGPRYSAAVACQLQCAYSPTVDNEWACSQSCNDRFMRLGVWRAGL